MREISAVSIRPANAADKAEWTRMRSTLWPAGSEAEHESEVHAYIGDSSHRTAFVAVRGNGALAGFIEVRLRDFADGCSSSPVGFLEGWYVDGDLRRRGVGTRLVAAAEAWAIARGCREMASDTELDNATSQAAHCRLGYAEVERVVRFRKSLDDDAVVTASADR